MQRKFDMKIEYEISFSKLLDIPMENIENFSHLLKKLQQACAGNSTQKQIKGEQANFFPVEKSASHF